MSHVQSAVSDVEKVLKSSNGDVENLPAMLAVVEERLGKCLFFLRKFLAKKMGKILTIYRLVFNEKFTM